ASQVGRGLAAQTLQAEVSPASAYAEDSHEYESDETDCSQLSDGQGNAPASHREAVVQPVHRLGENTGDLRRLVGVNGLHDVVVQAAHLVEVIGRYLVAVDADVQMALALQAREGGPDRRDSEEHVCDRDLEVPVSRAAIGQEPVPIRGSGLGHL